MDNQVQEIKSKKNDAHHRLPRRNDIFELSLNKFHSNPRNIISAIKEAEKRLSSLNKARLRVTDELQERRKLDRDFDLNNTWCCGHQRHRCNDRADVLFSHLEDERSYLQYSTELRICTIKKFISSAYYDIENLAVKNMRCRIKDGKRSLAAERKILGELKQAEALAEIAETSGYIDKKHEFCSDKTCETIIRKRLKVISRHLEWLNNENNRVQFNTAETEVAILQRELEKIMRSEDEVRSYILELKSQIL